MTSGAAANSAYDELQPAGKSLYYRFPAIADDDTYGVVNAAHFNLEKVKELVTKRPELAKTGWDWGYGDYETAIGACSHTGRRDIAEFLMSYGAWPDMFTFAMLGMHKSLMEIIESRPGIQSTPGPHGITLLKHAQNRIDNKEISSEDKASVSRVIEYLEKVGNANVGQTSLPYLEEDKKNFLGNYRFGEGETEVFNVGPYSLDPANFIRITRRGLPGRLLHKIGSNSFSPTGAPSVRITFEMIDGKSVSLTILESENEVKAMRI
jgi:hypothetical protein